MLASISVPVQTIRASTVPWRESDPTLIQLTVPSDLSVHSYAVTSVMSSRLILSLRHHAAKNDPLSASNKATVGAYASKHGGAVSHHHSGGLGYRTELGHGEKGAMEGGGMQAHIALDNLSTTFKKGDEGSQDGHQTRSIPGVYVITETKTAVDDHRLGCRG